jgi:hypothetical protein
MTVMCKSRPGGRLGRVALGTILVLTALKVWLPPATLTSTALAQIPDSGAQRNEMIEQTKRTNQLLADILETLRKQPFKVEMLGTDNTGATPRPAAGRSK